MRLVRCKKCGAAFNLNESSCCTTCRTPYEKVNRSNKTMNLGRGSSKNDDKTRDKKKKKEKAQKKEPKRVLMNDRSHEDSIRTRALRRESSSSKKSNGDFKNKRVEPINQNNNHYKGHAIVLDDKTEYLNKNTENIKKNPVGFCVVIDGVEKGNFYPFFEGDTTVGRSAEMDICISSDKSVSRDKHCIICSNKGDYLVDPVHMQAETLLNGEVIEESETIVTQDIITIGNTHLLVLLVCTNGFVW